MTPKDSCCAEASMEPGRRARDACNRLGVFASATPKGVFHSADGGIPPVIKFTSFQHDN